MSKTMEQIVTELADHDTIRELPQRYCDCVWRDDVEGIVNLFADDGVFTVIGSNREITNRGRAELLKTYKAGVELSPRPYIHNHVIELTGPSRATGRCYVELRDASGQPELARNGLLRRRIRQSRRYLEIPIATRANGPPGTEDEGWDHPSPGEVIPAKSVEQIAGELADREAIRELPPSILTVYGATTHPWHGNLHDLLS